MSYFTFFGASEKCQSRRGGMYLLLLLQLFLSERSTAATMPLSTGDHGVLEEGVDFSNIVPSLGSQRDANGTYFPDKLHMADICKNGNNTYGKCDTRKFAVCDEGYSLCFYRMPMNGTFYPSDDNVTHPVFYIDYNVAQCVPEWHPLEQRAWNCDKCSPGRFCKHTGYCMLEDNADKYCMSMERKERIKRREERLKAREAYLKRKEEERIQREQERLQREKEYEEKLRGEEDERLKRREKRREERENRRRRNGN